MQPLRNRGVDLDDCLAHLLVNHTLILQPECNGRLAHIAEHFLEKARVFLCVLIAAGMHGIGAIPERRRQSCAVSAQMAVDLFQQPCQGRSVSDQMVEQ